MSLDYRNVPYAPFRGEKKHPEVKDANKYLLKKILYSNIYEGYQNVLNITYKHSFSQTHFQKKRFY